MIKSLTNILEKRYLIKSSKISTQPGGWASLAYKIEDKDGELYFLKVYEKSRKSTPYLIQHIDTYLPIVDWLFNNTSLKSRIIRLIKPQDQSYMCEDENYIYILFDYIKGTTVGESLLSEEQVFNLADIVAQLHNVKNGFPFNTKHLYETFHFPFISKLDDWTNNKFKDLKVDLQEILRPKLSTIVNQIDKLNTLSYDLKRQNLVFNLCHTDIHHWNIIVQNRQLYLLDWEGIKFAPPEADIFSIYQQPYFDLFLKRYCEHHPKYHVNETALQYYLISRQLQDVFEFIEQLQFDKLDQRDYENNLNYLREKTSEMSD